MAADNSTARLPVVVASSGGHLTEARLAASGLPAYRLVTNQAYVRDDDPRCHCFVVLPFDTHRNPFLHLLNTIWAVGYLTRHRSGAVFSTGGPVALPFAVACKLTRRRFVYLDTMARVDDLSPTGRVLHRFRLADPLFCQWPAVAARYEGVSSHGPVHDLGDPGEQ